jgi:hypothetical protein
MIVDIDESNSGQLNSKSQFEAAINELSTTAIASATHSSINGWALQQRSITKLALPSGITPSASLRLYRNKLFAKISSSRQTHNPHFKHFTDFSTEGCLLQI